MRLIKTILIGLGILSGGCLHAQNNFGYRCKIEGVSAPGWHSLRLTPSVYANVNRGLTDLRIYGLSQTDTLEIPYLLKFREDEITDDIVELPMLNKSKKDGKQFMTFELKKGQRVNYLNLQIDEQNFNGYARIEGSEDQREWFNIDTLQRILSIRNEGIDFHSTTLNFPLTNYHFLRVSIKADKALTVTAASFKNHTIQRAEHPSLIAKWNAKTDRKEKTTTLDITLSDVQPVTSLSIEPDKSQDFYRPFTIQVVRDSVQAPKGWTYYYDQVYSGYLTSLNENNFSFPFTFTKNIRVIIQNADNAPLTIKAIQPAGIFIELTCSLTPGENFLYFGSPSVAAPTYDVVHFQDKIPKSLPLASLASSENLSHPIVRRSPLFENKIWLWTAMGAIIALLGFFTLRMMKTKVDSQ